MLNKVSSKYVTKAPTGVDALNTAICRLHSLRGSPMVSSEVVKASAVGATDNLVTDSLHNEEKIPLWMMRARNTTIDRPEKNGALAWLPVSEPPPERAEEPSASPSARACITRPNVKGYARDRLCASGDALGIDGTCTGSGVIPSALSSSPSSTSNSTRALDELVEACDDLFGTGRCAP